jgi:hypothetical protein
MSEGSRAVVRGRCDSFRRTGRTCMSTLSFFSAPPSSLPSYPDLVCPSPGWNRFRVRERETTVTELRAIASPAHSGFMVM